MIARAPLPVVLPPYRDELLSSWIDRHTAFYAVASKDVLNHCLGETVSLRTVDLRLREEHAAKLSYMFATEASHIRRMTFVSVVLHLHRFIARKPVQRCARCSRTGIEPQPVFRSDVAAWRITCKTCGLLFDDSDENGGFSSFGSDYTLALHGEALLDDEIEHGMRTWASPAAIARLLLLRRFGFPMTHGGKRCGLRILGAVIPEADSMCCGGSTGLPLPSHPILPLHLRRVWLAGVAIVMREGPAMLGILRQLVLNGNPIDCGEVDTGLHVRKGITEFTRQMQLIRESMP